MRFSILRRLVLFSTKGAVFRRESVRVVNTFPPPLSHDKLAALFDRPFFTGTLLLDLGESALFFTPSSTPGFSTIDLFGWFSSLSFLLFFQHVPEYFFVYTFLTATFLTGDQSLFLQAFFHFMSFSSASPRRRPAEFWFRRL